MVFFSFFSFSSFPLSFYLFIFFLGGGYYVADTVCIFSCSLSRSCVFLRICFRFSVTKIRIRNELYYPIKVELHSPLPTPILLPGSMIILKVDHCTAISPVSPHLLISDIASRLYSFRRSFLYIYF